MIIKTQKYQFIKTKTKKTRIILIHIFNQVSFLFSASRKGELQGKTEQSSTDRKRDRRKKKNFQKIKAHAEELKIKKKLQKMSKDGKSLDVSTSAKVVEKAIKKGQVKLVSILILIYSYFCDRLDDEYNYQTAVFLAVCIF